MEYILDVQSSHLSIHKFDRNLRSPWYEIIRIE